MTKWHETTKDREIMDHQEDHSEVVEEVVEEVAQEETTAQGETEVTDVKITATTVKEVVTVVKGESIDQTGPEYQREIEEIGGLEVVIEVAIGKVQGEEMVTDLTEAIEDHKATVVTESNVSREMPLMRKGNNGRKNTRIDSMQI